MATIPMKCDCKHKYQDEKYGKGLRVHNSMGKDKRKWRCTVCGNVKSSNLATN